MKSIKFAALGAGALLLGGCAQVAYKPIPLNNTFWQDRQQVVGVASDKLPEATAHMTGAQGLLDIAINKGNAEKMIERLKTLDVKRAAGIQDNLADALSRRGLQVTKLQIIESATLPEFKAPANPEQYAQRDFSGLKSKGINRLLYVTVQRVGLTRGYYGFIPTGAPRAVFAVTGQLIDLADNRLLWYNAHETTAVIADPWDQEPDFPNVSEAVLKNLLEGATQFERSLFSTGS
jgi:hypothetical protein